MNWLWVDNLNLCYHWSDVGWFRDVNRFRHYYWFNICWLNVVDHRRWHICSLNGITYEMLMVLISVLMDMHIFAMIVNDFRFVIGIFNMLDMMFQWFMINRLEWYMSHRRFDVGSLNGFTYDMLMVLISVLMGVNDVAMIVNDFRFMINFRFIVDWIMNGDNRLDNDWLMGDNRFDDDRFMDDDWINIVW